MRCYFLQGNQTARFEFLPGGLSDKGAVERADRQSLKRKARIDGLEVWDGCRLTFRRLLPIAAARWAIVQWYELRG